MWSDGATMWVADNIDEKVYAYNWPASDNTDLTATISGKTYSDGVPAPERAILGDTRLIFEDDLLVQQVSLEPNLAQVTTSLEAPHFLAEITALDLDDADSIMPGHQLELRGTLTARAEIQVTVTAQDGTTSTRSVVFTSQQCHGGMGAGRVAVNDEGICVILDTVLVQVADGFTVDEAADALLADFPAWTITSRLPGLGVVHATHVPDNLTLAQLEDQIGQIESKAWAQEAGFDTLVAAAIGSGSDSGSSGSGGSFGGGSFGGGFVSPPGSSFPPAGFGDTTGHRFAAAVRWLAAQGITAGCAPGSFCPDTPVTRAQMASFLARALELDPAQQPAGFTDVDPQSAHATNIDALHASGITAGCTQQPLQYCPDSPVTRAQMASFLARALELDPAQQPAGFTDVDPQSAARHQHRRPARLRHHSRLHPTAAAVLPRQSRPASPDGRVPVPGPPPHPSRHQRVTPSTTREPVERRIREPLRGPATRFDAAVPQSGLADLDQPLIAVGPRSQIGPTHARN